MRGYDAMQKRLNPEKERKKKRESAFKRYQEPDGYVIALHRADKYRTNLKLFKPEKLEELRQARAETSRIKRIDSGLKVQESKDNGTGRLETIENGPIMILVNKFLEDYKVGYLARKSGVSEKLIWRQRNEAGRISLDAADKLCIALGTTLALVYDLDSLEVRYKPKQLAA